ncbi:uncharacterized protein EAF02_007066 [Botrytis sinoallii]|uniref:uncharacterized protein n=1 Tax=Botrytis sinoallii TaxID=1463999 RepID=UPI0019012694|nr:uncharacterized protein EAF02_007066 [Botrytis sinoallii]KAF7881175.1 hypothetical protein EAF02_007066 [Botrytis sinoallii]
MFSHKRKASPDAEGPEASSSYSHLTTSETRGTKSSIQQVPKKRACSHTIVSKPNEDFTTAAETKTDSTSHDASNKFRQPTTHSPSLIRSDITAAKATKQKISVEAWDKAIETNKKTVALAETHRLREAEKYPPQQTPTHATRRQDTLYTTFSPSDWVCRQMWTSQSQEMELRSTHFDGNVEFRIWPEPRDWDSFEKYPRAGRKNLVRAREFVVFWLWDYRERIWQYTSNKASLKSCLEMFVHGEDEQKYQDFLARPM